MRYLILLMASASLAVTPTKAEPLPREIKPVMVWTGTSSNPTEISFHRCSSQKEWENVWHQHRGRDESKYVSTCPAIDFDAYMVIAFFEGASLKNHGVRIDGLSEEDGCIRVQYHGPLWQTGFNLEGNADDNSYKEEPQSYAFIVLPKSQKAVVFEQGTRFPPDAHEGWKEKAKLPATDKK